MITRTLILLCLVVACLSLPLGSKKNHKIRQRRNVFGVWDPYYHKRSRYDMFSKYDFDWNGKLSTSELTFLSYDHGFDWDTAYKFAQQQIRHDLDHDGQLSRWEFLRSEDSPMPFYYR